MATAIWTSEGKRFTKMELEIDRYQDDGFKYFNIVSISDDIS
jgi:hypothetical protein